MIQKNSKYDELFIKIQEICQQTLGFFVDKVQLQKANFPILEITYTIWRKYAFSRIKKKVDEKKQNQMNFITRIFYSLSQKKYLPKYIQRVQNQMNRYTRGLNTVQEGLKQIQKLPKQQQQIYGLIIELGQVVWQQQFYVQLLQDLIRLPYIFVISPNSTIEPKQEYATNFILQTQKKSKLKNIANNTGKNIFNKALTSITGTVISKAFLLKINTLFGAFNPIALGATFGMSSYLTHLDKKKKEEELQQQLKMAKQYTANKVIKLKEIYNKSLEQIQIIINLNDNEAQIKQNHKKNLKQLFLIIFQQQWLHIQVINGEDGWQTVLLEEKQSFQQL